MSRNVKRGALFVAPIVIASSLFAGSVSATQQRQVIQMQLDTICVDVTSHQAIYSLQNKNNFAISVDWKNLETGKSGTFNVPAYSFHGDVDPVNNPGLTPGYAADYDVKYANNTTQFTGEGWTSPNVTNARAGVACTPSQLPVTSNGGGTTTPPVVTPVTPVTPVTASPATAAAEEVAGKGAEAATVVAATPTSSSATLADTGAQQIIPLALAALVAVAVLGTTVAVRKNVL